MNPSVDIAAGGWVGDTYYISGELFGHLMQLLGDLLAFLIADFVVLLFILGAVLWLSFNARFVKR